LDVTVVILALSLLIYDALMVEQSLVVRLARGSWLESAICGGLAVAPVSMLARALS